MASKLVTELLKLNDNKQAIISALQSEGVDVTTRAGFKEFATHIGELTGEGAEDAPSHSYASLDDTVAALQDSLDRAEEAITRTIADYTSEGWSKVVAVIPELAPQLISGTYEWFNLVTDGHTIPKYTPSIGETTSIPYDDVVPFFIGELNGTHYIKIDTFDASIYDEAGNSYGYASPYESYGGELYTDIDGFYVSSWTLEEPIYDVSNALYGRITCEAKVYCLKVEGDYSQCSAVTDNATGLEYNIADTYYDDIYTYIFSEDWNNNRPTSEENEARFTIY